MHTDTKLERVALNADVVGYSALIADDVEATSAVLQSYRALVEDEVAANHGTIANFVGDSFMAVFDDAMAAVRAAIAITTEIEARNADVPPARRLRFRMGIDRGPVSEADGDYHGHALNIAARIQAIAPPGGIAVSGNVYREIDEPALRFRAMGPHQLKNIPEQVDVYEFADLPKGGPPPSRAPLDLEAPTVAVLPIHTEGVGDDVRAAAQVIRRDVLHRLARVADIRVIDAKTEPGDAGTTGARYILETGVHELAGRVRVYATLFDVTTMNIVKTHKRVADVEATIDLGDDLADDIARSVEVDLVVGKPAGLYAELDDPVAIERVYLGWYHLRTDTQEGWAHALDLFGEVADSHPDKPFGYALMAFALWIGASNGWVADIPGTFAEAREQARRGHDIGDPTGMSKAVEAAILISEGRPDEALDALQELHIVRPTCDVTYGLEGSVRRYLGDWQRAVELLDVAMRLTGINKPWYPTIKASSLYVGGRNEDAAYFAEGVLEYQPHNLEALLVLAAAQVEMGLDRRARATAELIADRFPSIDVEAWLEQLPYQRREIVDRWKGDLEMAGAIAPV